MFAPLAREPPFPGPRRASEPVRQLPLAPRVEPAATCARLPSALGARGLPPLLVLAVLPLAVLHGASESARAQNRARDDSGAGQALQLATLQFATRLGLRLTAPTLRRQLHAPARPAPWRRCWCATHSPPPSCDTRCYPAGAYL